MSADTGANANDNANASADVESEGTGESIAQRIGPGAPKVSELKARAMKLKPTIRLGLEGVSESWLRAMEDALERHELVKVKLTAHKEEKREIVRAIEEKTGAVCIQRVGFTAAYYRKRKGKEK